MSPILEVNDLHYYYGNIHAIKGISFHVNEGEIVTLIGANGAGKSTTLKTVSGLTSPKGVRGEIIFNGRNITGVSGDKITGMGLVQVLEGRHIFSQLTVYENLMMGAFLRKDTSGIREDCQRMYRMFPRLEERTNQLGGTLSGGEQQMLAIARALLARPKLILMDEPSLGLAPLIVKEIFQTILQIREEGVTVLLVEQNSKAALNTADRGYVLQTGHVLFEDTSKNLLQNEEIKRAYLGKH